MIFYDNASTTKVRQECLEELEHFCIENYFNPSTLYSAGIEVAKLLRQCRQQMLESLSGKGKLIFTSSGTEADNLALLGLRYPKGANFVLSPVEHSAICQTANYLKQQGYQVRFCRCSSSGKADIESIKELVDEHTALVSVMHICNETGAANDIAEIVKVVKSINKNTIVHSDGVQALGKLDINLKELGIDLYSISAHKINAPKGVGALFVKDGVRIFNIMYGGGQEYGLRPSTENVAGIMAFGRACHLAIAEREEAVKKYSAINQAIRTKVQEVDAEVRFISNQDCVPNILTFTSKKVRGEVLLHALSKQDIFIGTGSACSSSKKTGRIPQALGLQGEYRDGIVRLSFGKFNTLDEVAYFNEKFEDIYLELAGTIGR